MLIQPEGIIGIALVVALGSVSLCFFFSGLYQRYRLIRLGGKVNRCDHIPKRLAALIPLAFGQRTLLNSVTRNDRAGITHIFIFWGGIAFIFGYVFFVFAPAFSDDFAPKVLGQGLATVISFAADILGILALIALVWGLIRRFLVRPVRQTASKAWLYFSVTIIVLLFSYFMMEAFRIIGNGTVSVIQFPVGVPLAKAMSSLGLTQSQAHVWHDVLWWFMFAVISAFLIHSRYSGHMHAIAAPVNFFFKSLEPKGELKPINMETDEGLATATIEDLTWKELLDGLTCTECGRCQMECPAYLSGKALNPKEIIQQIREKLLVKGPSLLNKKPDIGETLFGEADEGTYKEAVWDCTTCGACQQACPVAVEHVGSFVNLRRQLVDRGSVSPDISNALKNIHASGNPWGQSQAGRDDLVRQLGMPLAKEAGEMDFLYWIGCASVYDERARNITRAVSSLLHKAGVKYAVLGSEEKCCGDPARRIGEEGLFQLRAEANVETLKKYHVRRIIAHCPHCYNSFKNEYHQLGANFEVIHHSELILELIRTGKLTLTRPLDYQVTFHDPCYLGRYNDLYNMPRQVIEANRGLKLVEMRSSREGAFCCGAGGGHLWMAAGKGSPIENMRLEQAKEVGAQCIVSACPYCAIMLDAAATPADASKIRLMDISELVMEAI